MIFEVICKVNQRYNKETTTAIIEANILVQIERIKIQRTVELLTNFKEWELAEKELVNNKKSERMVKKIAKTK